MHLQVVSFPKFDKRVKRLKKRYKKIADDILNLKEVLIIDPYSGDEVFKGCYKIRIQNSSIKKGKNAGFRIIYYYLGKDNNIYLVEIYSKSDQENIKNSDLIKLIKDENLN